jgi:type II secretory pathway pseudopilin PulG
MSMRTLKNPLDFSRRSLKRQNLAMSRSANFAKENIQTSLMKKNGQIWVESVIYTLIGLTLISVVLALAMPKINAYKDKVVVEQSIQSMNVFDSKIREVADAGEGNVRKVELFYIKRGKITFNSSGDQIIFLVDELTKPYSELGVVINAGATKVISEQGGKTSKANIILDYSKIADITFENSTKLQEYAESSTPYSFSIENKGTSGGRVRVNIREDSGR